MRYNNRKFCPGFNLIELVISMSISFILILVMGVLVVSGTNAWQQTYEKAHRQIDEDVTAVTTAFGSIGRKSNRAHYVIYDIAGSTFTPAVSATPTVDTTVSGDAVEFRYWDVELDESDTYNLMDDDKEATAYALFYLNNGQLKVDYGSYNWVTDTGAVPTGGGIKNSTGINTVVLAENVSAGAGAGPFSHTMLSGIGKGCVRMNIILTDPTDGEQIRVMASVLLRNIWPR